MLLSVLRFHHDQRLLSNFRAWLLQKVTIMKMTIVIVFAWISLTKEDNKGLETLENELKSLTENITEVPGHKIVHTGGTAEALRHWQVRLEDFPRCFTGVAEGTCYEPEQCFRKGGQVGPACLTNGKDLTCCTFVHTCGDVSMERVSYFRSPEHPKKSSGTLACDYDVVILDEICAVRVVYENVNLARKLGGVCDIDQITILNSVDGPTTGQCGPLSGYSTTVAVNPGQLKPLKIALVIQNEETYHWYIKVVQLHCKHLNNFKAPKMCGHAQKELLMTSSQDHIAQDYPNAFQWWRESKWRRSKHIWWSYPEPVFNMFYYGSTKRYLQQHEPVLRYKGKDAQRRIVAGVEAILGEFPWSVAIGLDQLFFCGGALISNLFVLTAAHCLMTRDTPMRSLTLHIGDHDLTSYNETSHVLRGVRRILFHSHFHTFLLTNDIALLQLDEPITFTDTIQPICLPHSSDGAAGNQATVIGWGITAFPTGEPSPVLMKLQVETLPNLQCARIIAESVGPGMLCAAQTGHHGTCFGDSGGPLIVQRDDGSSVLIGVVSFGLTGCAVLPAFPDLYTRVSEYIKWIAVNAML